MKPVSPALPNSPVSPGYPGGPSSPLGSIRLPSGIQEVPLCMV